MHTVRAIFISYRRSDSEGEAGRLSDVLNARFSDQSVFMDVDSIQPGRDFRRAIEESIQACSVVLVLIGPNWLEAQDGHGGRRLDAPNDYVRLEIAAALRRDVPVIPILIRGARMPQADHLPQEIHELAYRNSVELTHARWKSDLQILIDALDPLLHKPAAAPVSRPELPVRPVTPAPATYRHAATPPPLYTPAATHHDVSRPGPSARRAAYVTPLPRSPFADTPTTIIRPHVRSVGTHPAESVPAPIPVTSQPAAAPAVHHQVQQLPSAQAPRRPEPEPIAPVALEATAIDRVSRELAHFIGPIAEIVVKRAARRSATLPDLCAIVSHEIESAPDRARFLAQCRK